MPRYMIVAYNGNENVMLDATGDAYADVVAEAERQGFVVNAVVEVVPGMDYDKDRYEADADNGTYCVMVFR